MMENSLKFYHCTELWEITLSRTTPRCSSDILHMKICHALKCCNLQLQSFFFPLANNLLILATSCIPALQCQCFKARAESLSSDCMIKVPCDWVGQGRVWEPPSLEVTNWSLRRLRCAFIVLLGTVVNVLSQQDVLLCTSVYCVAASGLKLELPSLWIKQCTLRYPDHHFMVGRLLHF